MNRMRDVLMPCWGAVIAFLKVGLAMRFNFFMSLLVTLVASWVLVSVWRIIHGGSTTVQGVFGEQELVTYVIVAQVVNLARMGWINRNIVYRSLRHVRTGQIALDLARPIDLQVLRYVEWAAVFVVDLLLVAVPVWLVWYVSGSLALPASPVDAVFFFVSVALAWFVMCGIHFLVSLLIVWTYDEIGLLMVRTAIQEFFGGTLIPLALMPAPLAVLAAIMPFQAVVYTPVSIYLGRLQGQELIFALGIQAAWGVALLLAGRWLWGRAAPKLEIQGG